MNLSLKELGQEYERSIVIQQNVIEENRKKLHKARLTGNFTEMKRLNCLLRVLYEEKSELEEKANQLKSYYA